MQIIPVVMEKEWKLAEARLEQIFQSTKYVQADITDNVYVAGKSFEMELLNTFQFAERMLWDIHLLVKEPKSWLEKCIHVGAVRVTGQVEMMNDREEFVSAVKNEGVEAGLGFDIDTPVDNIPEETDFVLLMSRKAGYIPLPLDQKVIEKIKKAREINEGRDHKFLIGIDGGVNNENLELLEEAGADVVYSESAYFDLINAHRH